MYNVLANSTQHPEFASLLGNLLSAVSDGGSSNIPFGITAALENFASYDTYMKVSLHYCLKNWIQRLLLSSSNCIKGQLLMLYLYRQRLQ